MQATPLSRAGTQGPRRSTSCARLPFRAAAFVLTLAGCGAPAVAPTVATDKQPSPEAKAPDAGASPTVATGPGAATNTLAPEAATKPPSQSKSAELHVTAGMRMSGNIDDKRLVAAAQALHSSLSPCAVIIRKTDTATGSLNLHVEIDASGRVKPKLQSPVDAPGERCLLDAIRAWSLSGAGTGEAMLLLSFVPPPKY